MGSLRGGRGASGGGAAGVDLEPDADLPLPWRPAGAAAGAAGAPAAGFESPTRWDVEGSPPDRPAERVAEPFAAPPNFDDDAAGADAPAPRAARAFEASEAAFRPPALGPEVVLPEGVAVFLGFVINDRRDRPDLVGRAGGYSAEEPHATKTTQRAIDGSDGVRFSRRPRRPYDANG